MPHKAMQQNGAILLITLVLTLISSVFILLFYQQQQHITLTHPIRIDALQAENIAKLGIEIGLNEWKTNLNAKNQFTPNQPVLIEYTTMGGALNLYFNSSTGTFNNNPITIVSVGTYSGISKRIAVDVYL